MGEKEIYQWLHQAREAGLSDMKIVENLRNQGWSHDQIDKILVGAYSEKKVLTPTPPQPEEKIFSPAEKFIKERKGKSDPLDPLDFYQGPGAIGKIRLLIKNHKLIFLFSSIIIILISFYFIYYSTPGIKNIDLANIDIGSQGLVDENIDLIKLPFTYQAPASFNNDFNNKYKNGYSSTYSYDVPNTTDSINVNIYLEENDNDLTARQYLEINEGFFENIYDTSTILTEGEISIDNSTGYNIEKTYEFFNSKKYSNTVVYIKKDYIVEITLESASLYYLDYKNLFITSLNTFRLQ